MISVMMSHWMGARIMVGEIMDSWVSGTMDDSCSLDRASAFVFCVPGRYVTEKSKWVKNKAHLACLWLSLSGRTSNTPGCDDQSTL